MMRLTLALLLAFAPPPDLAPDPAPDPGPDPGGQAAPSPAPAPAPSPAPAATRDAPITVTTRLTPDPSHVGDLLELEVIVDSSLRAIMMSSLGRIIADYLHEVVASGMVAVESPVRVVLAPRVGGAAGRSPAEHPGSSDV